MNVRCNLKKAERLQVSILCEELGHTDVTVEAGGKHKKVFWRGGSVIIAGSPGDGRALLNFRAQVRRRINAGRSSTVREPSSA